MADGESVSDPGPGDDSKREIRTNVSLPARITTVSPLLDPATGKSFYRASEELCENISPSGAFVMTREPLPQGERILLEIDLPDGEEVATLGRVCWARARPRRPTIRACRASELNSSRVRARITISSSATWKRRHASNSPRRSC